VLLLLLGIGVLVWPGAALTALVLLFGVFALLDGITDFVGVFDRSARSPRWLLVLEGLAGIGVFVIAFAWPGLTLLALVYLFAAWALVTGVVQIVMAIDLRKVLEHEWLLGARGALSVLFGLLALVWPKIGLVVMVALIATFALLGGVLSIVAGVRLRKFREVLGTYISGPRTIDHPR